MGFTLFAHEISRVNMLNKFLFSIIFTGAALTLQAQNAADTMAAPMPVPNKYQLAWQQLETNGFIHYGANNPGNFKPSGFDARQIVHTMKEAGFKIVVLTAKHHGGFCLWPSKYTKYSVEFSKWKDGKGDVVREVADACREFGVGFGVYLSPWDKKEETYGTPAYNDFYKNQLRELLTNYGPIAEVWFDGYKARDAKPMTYDWDGYFNLVRELQPQAIIFSDIGPDVRWVGNEKGNAAETCWSTINAGTMLPGVADPAYLNTGDPNGISWMPAETDVSIRPGWFYNPAHDTLIKSGKELVDIYYQSVGRNSLLLLNVPPNHKGFISDDDRKSLLEFRSILNETFHTNLANKNVRKELTDQQLATFITVNEKENITWNFKKPVQFDRVMLQENIAHGQRHAAGKLEYWNGEEWKPLAEFTTIGYKRLLRLNKVSTKKIRFTVVAAKLPVELAEIGFYKASSRE